MSIIRRPYAVTDFDIARHGSCPTMAPVKPYTELALIFSASCRPFCTAFLMGSVSFAMSRFATLRAASSSRRMMGSTPSRSLFFTKRSPVGAVSVRLGSTAIPLGTSVE